MRKVATAIALGVVILKMANVAAQEPLFAPASSSPITVGKGSGEVILADINRDGHLDLMTKHLLSKTISLLVGDGKAHFAPFAGTAMVLDYSPGAVALADINRDKILDLAIASRDDAQEYVHVLLGDGRGQFAPVPRSPFTVHAAMKFYKPNVRIIDINEDGTPDLVTSNGRRNSIEILPGDGRDGFAPGPVVKLNEITGLNTFLFGDVDGDGHLDLVTAGFADSDQSAHFVALRGDGKGSFTNGLGAALSVPIGARVWALADVNGDQHPDVVLGHSTNRISILTNEGNGVFSPSVNLSLRAKMFAWDIAVTDVNQDKQADLIVATVNSETAPFESEIVVLLGNNGKFASAPGSPFHAEPGAYRLTVGDVNEDGKVDIAASSFETTGMTLLLGR